MVKTEDRADFEKVRKPEYFSPTVPRFLQCGRRPQDSFGNLLQIQILESYPKLDESKTLEMQPKFLHYNKSPASNSDVYYILETVP